MDPHRRCVQSESEAYQEEHSENSPQCTGDDPRRKSYIYILIGLCI